MNKVEKKDTRKVEKIIEMGLAKLGITPKKLETAEECHQEVYRLKIYSEIGLFLIMLIQIVQEFYDWAYLNHVLITIGMIEIFLYFFCLAGLGRVLTREKGSEVENWNYISEYHSSYVYSIVIPMVFFFNGDVVNFAGTRIQNIELYKEILILVGFLSVLYYKWIGKFLRRKLESTADYNLRIYSIEEKDGKKIEKFTQFGILRYTAMLLDIVLWYGILVLCMGMMLKEERLSMLVMIAGLSIGYYLVYPMFVVDGKKVIRRGLGGAIVFCISSMLYEQYLLHLDITYDLEPSVYKYEQEFDSGAHVDVFCRFDNVNNEESLTYYFLYYDSEENIEHYAIGEFEIETYLFREGLTTWYDSEFVRLSKKDAKKYGEIPVEMQCMNETVVLSEEFPDVYKPYVYFEKFVYKEVDDCKKELMAFNEQSLWFRYMSWQKVTELSQDALQLEQFLSTLE